MKYPKPKLYRDGRKRLSIKIEYIIDKDILILILASMIDNMIPTNIPDDDLDLNKYELRPAINKRMIYEKLKELLESRGSNIWRLEESFWHTNYNEELIQWAKKNISIWFPELD